MTEDKESRSYWKDPGLVEDLKKIRSEVDAWPKWMQRLKPNLAKVSPEESANSRCRTDKDSRPLVDEIS